VIYWFVESTGTDYRKEEAQNMAAATRKRKQPHLTKEGNIYRNKTQKKQLISTIMYVNK